MATSAKQWNKDRGEDLLLPSGNTARVKRPGPEALLRKGVLPDALAGMVSDIISKSKGQQQRALDTKKLAENPQNLVDMMDAMDRVLATVVLEPKVLYHQRIQTGDDGAELKGPDGKPLWEEIPEEDRNEDILYSDDIDFEDKAFIFNYAVGGTRDIARFRRDSRLSVGNVPDEQVNEQSSKSTASN